MTTAGWQRFLVEPPRPERVRALRNAHWLVVAAVCVGAFMGQLDASIVTLATPALQEHFNVSLAAASWVALSYLLTLVAAVVPIGWLADAGRRKMLYGYGFAVFTLGSDGCAVDRSLRAIAEIPITIAEQWAKEGVDIFNPDHSKECERRLNDPALRGFRIGDPVMNAGIIVVKR